jgi:D-lactate dehydrogenase (cytochrome)
MITVKKDGEEILSYLEDASNFKEGRADKVYIPEDETELKQVLLKCAEEKTFVTISGGGTGTVGGRVPREGVIISLEKFNRIFQIDREKKTSSLQAGVVVKIFLEEIDKLGFFYPPFPTERTAFIGGNVATNASGEYSFRFGPTRRYVKKIRMVLTTGKVLEVERGSVYEKDGVLDYGNIRVSLPSYRTPCIKCSAGYFSQEGMDIIDLLIGSEGTLGVITEVDVSMIDALPPRLIIILFLPADRAIPEIVREIKKDFNEKLYSLEFFDRGSLEFLKKDFLGIPGGTCAVYAETDADSATMEKWAETSDRHNAVDTWVGEDEKNYERLIDFRHRLPENINAYFKKIGLTKVAMDIAVPEQRFPEMYDFYRDIMEREKMHTILFGHIGESHLHFNLFPSGAAERVHAWEIYEICVNKALSFGGTVAAEHGIGKIKHKWLGIMYGEKGLKDMVQIKKTFDPHCILGPDNIFPRELLK